MTAGGIARRLQDVASSRRRSAFASSSMTGSAFQRIRLQIFEGDQLVSVEHGEIEKLARDLNANGVQTKIFRTGATKPVAIKSGYWIAATTFQFSSKNIRRHNHRTVGLINR